MLGKLGQIEAAVPAYGRMRGLRTVSTGDLTEALRLTRDLCDRDDAVRHLALDVTAPQMTDMVRRKRSGLGDPPVDMSEDRLTNLRRPRETRVGSVLRRDGFEAFDLDKAMGIVAAVVGRLGLSGRTR